MQIFSVLFCTEITHKFKGIMKVISFMNRKTSSSWMISLEFNENNVLPIWRKLRWFHRNNNIQYRDRSSIVYLTIGFSMACSINVVIRTFRTNWQMWRERKKKYVYFLT